MPSTHQVHRRASRLRDGVGLAVCLSAVVAASPASAEAPEPTITATVSPAPVISLDELVGEALQHNLQIRAEETRIGEAKALYQRAAALAFPTLSFSALIGGPTPEAKTTVINDPGTATPPSIENDLDFGELGFTLRVSAQLAQPLYTFGKVRKAKMAASDSIRAAKHNVRITAAEVLVNVYQAYWAHMLTQSYVSGLEDGEKILVHVLGRIEALIDDESPQVTENDRLRILHALATIRVRLTDARVGRRLTLQALKLLVGREQNDELTVQELDIEEIPEGLAPVEDLKAEAASQRPELRALQAVANAQDHFADFRMLQLFPDIFLGGVIDIAYTSNATDQTNPFIYDRFNYFDLGIGIGLRAQLDVFQTLAETEIARADLRTTVARLNAVKQAVDLELETVHGELAGNYTRLADVERALTVGRGWLTSAALAYDIGTGNARELVDAFIARATAEADYFKTCFDIQVGLAKLERAVGRLGQTP